MTAKFSIGPDLIILVQNMTITIFLLLSQTVVCNKWEHCKSWESAGTGVGWSHGALNGKGTNSSRLVSHVWLVQAVRLSSDVSAQRKQRVALCKCSNDQGAAPAFGM